VEEISPSPSFTKRGVSWVALFFARKEARTGGCFFVCKKEKDVGILKLL
jgi:hypothetical protein